MPICSPARRTALVVAVVVLFLLGSLSLTPLIPISSGTDWTPIDSSPGDDIEIADELESTNGTVEVIVRLEEARIPTTAYGDDDTVEAILETHANETQTEVLEYAHETPGLDVYEEFWVTNAMVLEVDTDQVDFESFRQFDPVTEVHKNVDIPVPEPAPDNESDEELAEQTRLTTGGIAMMNVPAVWDEYETQGEGVRVAVLDTGVDASHPDIDLYTDDPTDPTYPGGWAEFNRSGAQVPGSTPSDSDIHGTHVSGTVAGGDAAGGHIGVAPDAELLHGQVLTGTGGSFAQIVAGIEWALEQDADVINLSLGTTGYVDQLIPPLANAEQSGVVVVTAVGNDGHETSGSPANIYSTTSVGAVDATADVASFSGGETINRSAWQNPPSTWPEAYIVPDVVAPGVGIYSAVPNGGYEQLPGTSMATPHVSGTAALLLAIDPEATPADIEAVLTETAWKPDGQPLEKDERYGYGIVDAPASADALTELAASREPLEDISNDSLETDNESTIDDDNSSDFEHDNETTEQLEVSQPVSESAWSGLETLSIGVIISVAVLVVASALLHQYVRRGKP